MDNLYHVHNPAFRHILRLVGPLGELWVVLPLAVALSIWCFMSGERRGALAIVVVTAGTLALTVFLKLFSTIVGPPWRPDWEWISSLFPSGHMTMGTVVYGTLAICVSRSMPRLGPLVGLLVVVMLGLLGAQRLVFLIHPILDVIGGGLLGALGLMVLVRLWPHGTLRPIGMPLVAVALALILYTFYGREVPSSQMLERMAARVHAAVDAFKADKF